MSLFVYALAARGRGAPGASGVAGERLTIVPIGRFDAVVGVVARRPRATPGSLRRYDTAVRSVWERRPAVLPARYGTIVRDRAELEAAVRDRQRAILRQLALVRNRAQMTVRVVDEQAGRSNAAAPTTGTAYLRARARLASVPAFAPVRRHIRRWIRDERIERSGRVATIYHLVPRSAVGRYLDVVPRAAEAARVRLSVSGPWPPYAFAEGW